MRLKRFVETLLLPAFLLYIAKRCLAVSGPPPDYSDYMHWFYYFSPITLSWLSSGLVPLVVHVPPPLPLLVGYASKAAVYWGNELSPTHVRQKPVFLHWPVEKKKMYTLVMLDPDVEQQFMPSIAHWVVINIPENHVDLGNTIVEYVGSFPRRGTGTHRYAFLVYKQSKHIYASGYPEVDSRTFTQRQQFNLTDFAHHFHLGYPIAGNFFNATYDDYVPFILKQLGIN